MSFSDGSRTTHRRTSVLLILAIVLVFAVDAAAQIEIGFCQGDPGVFETFTICFLVCCPGDLVPTKICVTTPPVDCGSASAVMAAINAAIATMSYGGNPVFGTPFPVPSPIGGQARYGYPLDAGFSGAGCCVVGGSASFDCGTVSLRINSPCAKPGGGGGGGGPIKPLVLGPAPAFPSTLVIQFIGCPAIMIPLAGGESDATVKALLVAALTTAGYTAFININGDVEVTSDCNGTSPPLGIDEYGLSGGVAMSLGVFVCPPTPPIGTDERSWGEVKGLYRENR